MYNCTKLHTGSAIARVTKDRAARPHLPSTVENQLWRKRQRRQLLTIEQWNVRTLPERDGANRPERRTALVAMVAKYNIDIAALCETRFSESGSLDDLEYSFWLEWQTRRWKKGGRSGLCYQEGYCHKADRNATASKWQNHDDETTSEQGQLCYNYQRVRSNNDKPRLKHGGLLQPAGQCAQWHPSYRQATADRRLQCEDRKRKWQVALGHGQTWDWEMQLQWRASTGSVLWVRTDSDEHHVQAEGWTQDHLDASSFQTLAYDRLHHHEVSG